MRSRLLALLAALTLGFAGLIALGCGDDDEAATSADTEATTTGSTSEATTTEASGPDPATCVDAWNSGSNAAAQEEASALYGNDDVGNVIVGSEEGTCVLASYNTSETTYVVYQQSGDSFAEADGGPGDQFNQYRESIDFVDVILQRSGKVEAVSG